MTDAWFSIETARLFPFLSFLALLASLEIFAARGLYRRTVMAIGWGSVVLGVALFVAGLVALASGQPRFVSGPLLLTGVVLGATCLGGLFGLRKLYATAELRKVASADL